MARREARMQTRFTYESYGKTNNPPSDTLRLGFPYQQCDMPRKAYVMRGDDVHDLASNFYLEQKNRYCWKVSKFHPFRLPGCPGDNSSYLTPLEWPYIVTKGPLVLYQFYRTKFCVPEAEIVPLEVYNLDNRSTNICWVPIRCGPFSNFHIELESCNIRVKHLALEFGIDVSYGISKGLFTFMYGLVWGRHTIQELYIGRCPICKFTLCHLDGSHRSCIQCQDCDAYFISDTDFKEHQDLTKHYFY